MVLVLLQRQQFAFYNRDFVVALQFLLVGGEGNTNDGFSSAPTGEKTPISTGP